MVHTALFVVVLGLTAAPVQDGLAGRVVDAEKKPIVGATVFIYTARPRVGQGVLCPSCYLDCNKRALSNAEGKFHIAGLDPELLFRVLVAADGYQPKFAKDVDPLKGSLEIRLQSMPGDFSGRAVLRGRVLDPAGKPVVGAVVSPFGCKSVTKRWWGALPGVDAAAVTDLQGEFLITGKAGDLGYDVEVEARGLARQLVELLPTGEEVREIRLTEGATVCGRIMQDGRPAVGVAMGLVQCTRESGKFVGEYRIATDSDGRFAFLNVHPNDEYFLYSIMDDATRRGVILRVERVAVAADGTTANVGNRPLAAAVHRLAGRIILTDGKAVPRGTRLLLSRDEAWDHQEAVAAADGSFLFTGVPEEPMIITCDIQGYRLAHQRNRFQQVGPGRVALFVDADRTGLELFFEPKQPRRTTK